MAHRQNDRLREKSLFGKLRKSASIDKFVSSSTKPSDESRQKRSASPFKLRPVPYLIAHLGFRSEYEQSSTISGTDQASRSPLDHAIIEGPTGSGAGDAKEIPLPNPAADTQGGHDPDVLQEVSEPDTSVRHGGTQQSMPDNSPAPPQTVPWWERARFVTNDDLGILGDGSEGSEVNAEEIYDWGPFGDAKNLQRNDFGHDILVETIFIGHWALLPESSVDTPSQLNDLAQDSEKVAEESLTSSLALWLQTTDSYSSIVVALLSQSGMTRVVIDVWLYFLVQESRVQSLVFGTNLYLLVLSELSTGNKVFPISYLTQLAEKLWLEDDVYTKGVNEVEHSIRPSVVVAASSSEEGGQATNEIVGAADDITRSAYQLPNVQLHSPGTYTSLTDGNATANQPHGQANLMDEDHKTSPRSIIGTTGMNQSGEPTAMLAAASPREDHDRSEDSLLEDGGIMAPRILRYQDYRVGAIKESVNPVFSEPNPDNLLENLRGNREARSTDVQRDQIGSEAARQSRGSGQDEHESVRKYGRLSPYSATELSETDKSESEEGSKNDTRSTYLSSSTFQTIVHEVEAEKFFVQGRVLRVLWHNRVVAEADIPKPRMRRRLLGMSVFAQPKPEVRPTPVMFVIVKAKIGFCLAAQILESTGSINAALEESRESQPSTRIYDLKHKLHLAPGERLRRKPIAVKVTGNDLGDFCRVNFAKLYTIEWSYQVQDVGMVRDGRDMRRLIHYFLSELSSDEPMASKN